MPSLRKRCLLHNKTIRITNSHSKAKGPNAPYMSLRGGYEPSPRPIYNYPQPAYNWICQHPAALRQYPEQLRHQRHPYYYVPREYVRHPSEIKHPSYPININTLALPSSLQPGASCLINNAVRKQVQHPPVPKLHFYNDHPLQHMLPAGSVEMSREELTPPAEESDRPTEMSLGSPELTMPDIMPELMLPEVGESTPPPDIPPPQPSSFQYTPTSPTSIDELFNFSDNIIDLPTFSIKEEPEITNEPDNILRHFKGEPDQEETPVLNKLRHFPRSEAPSVITELETSDQLLEKLFEIEESSGPLDKLDDILSEIGVKRPSSADLADLPKAKKSPKVVKKPRKQYTKKNKKPAAKKPVPKKKPKKASEKVKVKIEKGDEDEPVCFAKEAFSISKDIFNKEPFIKEPPVQCFNKEPPVQRFTAPPSKDTLLGQVLEDTLLGKTEPELFDLFDDSLFAPPSQSHYDLPGHFYANGPRSARQYPAMAQTRNPAWDSSDVRVRILSPSAPPLPVEMKRPQYFTPHSPYPPSKVQCMSQVNQMMYYQ